jgi:serine/threonine protein kinase
MLTPRRVNITRSRLLERRYHKSDADAVDLADKLLALDPKQRIGTAAAIEHPFFKVPYAITDVMYVTLCSSKRLSLASRLNMAKPCLAPHRTDCR